MHSRRRETCVVTWKLAATPADGSAARAVCGIASITYAEQDMDEISETVRENYPPAAKPRIMPTPRER